MGYRAATQSGNSTKVSNNRSATDQSKAKTVASLPFWPPSGPVGGSGLAIQSRRIHTVQEPQNNSEYNGFIVVAFQTLRISTVIGAGHETTAAAAVAAGGPAPAGPLGSMAPSKGANQTHDISDMVQKRLQQLPTFARELLAGGAAGGLAKTCVAPLERTKIIFQTRGGKMTVSGVLQHIWQNEGVPGLFRGNTASVLRIVPYAAIHFGSYEYIRRFIVQLSGAEGGHGPDAPSALPIYDLLAGSASGAIAVIATYPLDLVRTRLAWATEAPAKQQLAAIAAGGGAASQAVQHPGIWATLRGTMADEGVAGLYRGCAPTLLGILPYAGLKFYVYQAMKNRYRTWQIAEDKKQQQQQQEEPHLPPPPPFETALQQVDLAEEEQLQRPQKLPVSVTLVFGGVAGLVAQTVTYPLDVIRRQMQVSHLQVTAQARSSVQASAGGSSNSSGSSSAQHAGGQQQRALLDASTSHSSSRTSCRAGPAGTATQHQRVKQKPLSATSIQQQRQPAQRAGTTMPSPVQCQQQQQQQYSTKHVVSMPGSSNSSSITRQLRFLSNNHGQSAAAAAAAEEPSMAEVARRLWRQGGMFRGLSINYLKVVPSTAIGFTVYDYMKAYLGLTHT